LLSEGGNAGCAPTNSLKASRPGVAEFLFKAPAPVSRLAFSRFADPRTTRQPLRTARPPIRG